MKKLIALTFLTIGLMTGCGTLYKTIISITDVRNSVMNELGRQYRAGKISPEVDRKIAQADKAYRDTTAVAQSVLETYKTSGNGDPVASITAVKNTVTVLIDILATYTDASTQYRNLSTATKL